MAGGERGNEERFSKLIRTGTTNSHDKVECVEMKNSFSNERWQTFQLCIFQLHGKTADSEWQQRACMW